MLGQFLDNPARYYQLNGRLCAVVHIRYKEMKINNQSLVIPMCAGNMVFNLTTILKEKFESKAAVK